MVSADLELALALADVAAAMTVPRFERRDFQVEIKRDGSPVTNVDREVEQVLRTRLAAARPQDAILGEEFGEDGDSDRRWYLDPIDGTSWFVEGTLRWATLIALRERDVTVAAVIDLPALGERWWAAVGGGAFRNGRRVRTSARTPLATAVVANDARRPLEGMPRDHPLLAVSVRAGGIDSGDHDTFLAVAAGSADVAIGLHGFEWDFAPYPLILGEAGGRFTDLGGSPRIDSQNGLATNGLVHDEVLDAIRSPRSGQFEPRISR